MQRPPVHLAALLIAGLVIGVTVPALGGWVALLAAVVCLATVAEALWRRTLDPGSRWVLLGVMALGVWQGARVETTWRRDEALLAPLGERRTAVVSGKLDREPRLGRNTVTLTLAPALIEARGEPTVQPFLGVDVMLLREDVASALDLRSLAIGDHIEVEGYLSVQPPLRNPGEFDVSGWRWERGVCASVQVMLSETVRVTPWKPSLWARGRRAMRNFGVAATATLERQQGAEAATFSRAVLLGDRTALDPADRQAFLFTGLGHLFAVSGLHTAMIFGLFLGALRLARCPGRLSLVIAALALWPYAALVGFRVSVVRAALILNLFVAGRVIGRTVDVLSALALAALVICLIDPRAPWQAGFQMSFLAVLSLILHAPLVRDLATARGGVGLGVWLGQVARRVMAAALLLLALHLAMFPLMAAYYGLWSWVAVPMNLLLVPVAFLVMLGSAVGLALAPLWPAAGDFVGAAAGGVVEGMLALVHAVGDWPGAAVTVTPMPWWAVGLWYAILFGGPSVMKVRAPDEQLRRRARWVIAWLALVALGLALPLLRSGSGQLRITFFDVGHGDATLIEMPRGAVIVVDGGARRFGNRGERVLAPALRTRGIGAIDLIVASHADEDHIGGLVHLLEFFPVHAVAEGHPGSETQVYVDFLAAIDTSGAEHRWLARGARITDGLAEISVLHPDADRTRRPAGTNPNSVILAVQWGESDILIMGDAERPAERTILDAFPDLDCDVLRTGHHGARNASGQEFLEAITPDVAVISCGRDRHTHPHAEHLARLEAVGARVLRTDALGALTLETDGTTFEITSAAGAL